MPVLTHADLRLNYQLIGPELTPGVTPLALIHGLGANLAFWYLGALRHLGRDRSVLLYDLRGHGASSMPERGYGLEQLAEDFRLLLDTLGIARAHVVGHSHGARVALVFALQYPERVASLTLADTQIRALQPPMRLGDWPHWPEWKADLAARGVTQFPPEDAPIDFRLLAELGPRSAGGSGPVALAGRGPDPLAGMPRGRLRRAGQTAGAGLAGAGLAGNGGFAEAGGMVGGGLAGSGGRRIDLQSRQMGARGAQQWQTLLETTTAQTEMQDESRIRPADLPLLTMPVLLLYGQLSHCVPTADRLLHLLPDARLVLVPGGGHFFPVVKPQFFTHALRVFLGRVEAGTRADAAVQPEAMPSGAESEPAWLAALLAPPLAASPAAALRLGAALQAEDASRPDLPRPDRPRPGPRLRGFIARAIQLARRPGGA